MTQFEVRAVNIGQPGSGVHVRWFDSIGPARTFTDEKNSESASLVYFVKGVPDAD